MATEGQAPIDICNKASYCIMKMCIKWTYIPIYLHYHFLL
jgi:hypothetical protein